MPSWLNIISMCCWIYLRLAMEIWQGELPQNADAGQFLIFSADFIA
jgi:hypothetical protein